MGKGINILGQVTHVIAIVTICHHVIDRKTDNFFFVSKYAHIVYHWKGKSSVSSVLAIVFSCHVTCHTSIVSYVSNSKIDTS